LIEFKQPVLSASRENEDMSFGIHRRASRFPKVDVRRKLQKVWQDLVGYFGCILNLGFLALNTVVFQGLHPISFLTVNEVATQQYHKQGATT